MFAPCDLVSSVIVHYQVNFKAAGEIRVDLVEKLQELLMPVSSIAIADHHAAGHVQGPSRLHTEQSRGPGDSGTTRQYPEPSRPTAGVWKT
jgi:hypothetical protein